MANITQDNGNTDMTVSFIAYKSGNTYYIDNAWDLEQYNPIGNHAVLNFPGLKHVQRTNNRIGKQFNR